MKLLVSRINLALIMAVICLSYAMPASAHRLNVFAWLEDDNVIVECSFGKNRPAQNAIVKVIDRVDKKELVSGKTNSTGHFIFTVPSVVRDGHGLIIDVNAGQGHHNEWEMDASELYSAAALTAGFDEARLESGKQGKIPAEYPKFRTQPRELASQPGAEANIALPGSQTTGAPVEGMRAMIQESIEKSIAPLRQQLAAMEAQGPSFVEIIGGLGWIAGIVGIILYFRSRRRP